MKRIFGVAAVVSVSLLLTFGFWGAESRSRTASPFHPSSAAPLSPLAEPGLTSTKSLSFQAYRLMQALAKPLLSLQMMQRAVAASDGSNLEVSPSMEVLTSDLTTVGLGPIRIGMTLAEVAAGGVSLQPLAVGESQECRYFQVKDGLEPVSFMAIDDRIIRIDVWPGSLIQTKGGAKIGSTEAEVLAYYPGRVETALNPKTQGKTLTFTPSGLGEDLYRLVFETGPDGKVVEFRAGQFPAVTWPKGCL